jgi:hypothetical protein
MDDPAVPLQQAMSVWAIEDSAGPLWADAPKQLIASAGIAIGKLSARFWSRQMEGCGCAVTE